jgi:hypothetical protein
VWKPGRSTSWLVAAALLVAWHPLSPAATGEDMIKSAAVLSFLRYSEWPPSPDASLTVGVLGRSSFFQVLRGDLDGKTVNGRVVRVIALSSNSDLHCCRLIYFAAVKDPELRQLLQNARSLRALTIGENERFLDYGGAVNLSIVDDRITFEASLNALNRSGISIGSNLLRLGQIRSRGKTGDAQ